MEVLRNEFPDEKRNALLSSFYRVFSSLFDHLSRQAKIGARDD